jgi:glycosyltransferase involved in cell wall biosynthesis
MPHIWTPLLAGAIKKMGVRYVTVVHDAVAHPGDTKGLVTSWLRSEARVADLVVTLSRNVADRLIYLGCAKPERVLPLFHPDLNFGGALAHRELSPERPLRLLFFGRVLPYKGLPLLIDAVELMRQEGFKVELGVWGEGDISKERARLDALGAVVQNRWFSETEVPAILAWYDVIALSHIEASQSGVAATAFGNLMPVVGMPIGGIPEQIIDGRTGILARRVSARSFADAIIRLSTDPSLYARISAHLTATAEDRGMGRFVSEIIDELSCAELNC